MKKVVRMLGLCALVALAFTSCKKNETNSNLTFKASMPQVVSNDRTFIDNSRYLRWSAGDEILVLSQGENETFGIVDGINEKNAAFDATGKGDFLANLTTDGAYFAFYPNAVPAENGATLSISDQQTRIATDFGASFNTNTFPMFAYNTSDNFQFHSNAGLLRIQLRKSWATTETVKVGSIELIAVDENDKLVGDVTYPTDYVLDPTSTLTPENASNQVTLTCAVAEELLTGTQSNPTFAFDFVLFEGALQGEFWVKVRNEEGDLIGNFKAGASYGDPDTYNHTILRESILVMPVREINGTIIPE